MRCNKMEILFRIFQLNRLLDLKSFCDSTLYNGHIQEFELSEDEWEDVMCLISILSPFDKYTKKLQSETVTLSDFFGFWTMIRIKLAKSVDDFSQKLLFEMNKKQEMLMENPAMVSAIYLDPRYQRGIKDKRPLAIQFLVNLFLKMKRVESFGNEINGNETIEDLREIEPADNSDNDSYDDMNAFLDACGALGDQPNTNK